MFICVLYVHIGKLTDGLIPDASSSKTSVSTRFPLLSDFRLFRNSTAFPQTSHIHDLMCWQPALHLNVDWQVTSTLGDLVRFIYTLSFPLQLRINYSSFPAKTNRSFRKYSQTSRYFALLVILRQLSDGRIEITLTLFKTCSCSDSR